MEDVLNWNKPSISLRCIDNCASMYGIGSLALGVPWQKENRINHWVRIASYFGLSSSVIHESFYVLLILGSLWLPSINAWRHQCQCYLLLVQWYCNVSDRGTHFLLTIHYKYVLKLLFFPVIFAWLTLTISQVSWQLWRTVSLPASSDLFILTHSSLETSYNLKSADTELLRSCEISWDPVVTLGNVIWSVKTFLKS